ncbi:hypothetical protein JF770_14850 [Mycobacterium intracellulare]|uniref:hypothetical protein n=1 Tax=Mycobacterium intracellulare TaxID=1767 RepID=UPI001CD9DA8B|nr:hypothetical protein [Mycobacterium intracellulare]MCA2304844.1 hypothetical protein [Mycobacterium intracellulare]MCA2347125.1 hypothetical protein [Mycobacterium intracellulare]
MTNPSQSAGGQSSSTDAGGQDAPPPPPPPDRSWIEFDIGIRNQDPGVIERKADRHD